ncbi:MAG: hypothetical protein LBB21_04875 [Holosporaceae bacterium]|jgi:hypothetical protein|nr:hypothetical protein [Holosporaceae bacterium]
MHDVVKATRIRNRMKFCANCAVSMFQNVSNGRPKKEIILKDYQYISGVASLPFYGGGEKQYEIGTSRRYYDGPLFGVTIYYIKGTGENIAQITWGILNFYYRNPSLRELEIITAETFRSENVFNHGAILLQKQFKKDCDTNEIYSGLTIREGETKIILDVYLYVDVNFYKPNGSAVNQHPWGFFIFKPQLQPYVTSGHRGYFHEVEIFTPRPGLFSETHPL